MTPLSSALQQHGQKLLDDTKIQAENLGNSEDSEALHNFRVSVRRLRSFLKSFEPYLKNSKKHRQKLSHIMDLTNAGRDTEVHILWLKARVEKASVLEESGISYLLEHLTNDEHIDLKKVKKQFAEAAKKLDKSFSSEAKVKAKESLTFSAASADVLKQHSDELQTLLQRIKNAEDEEIHEARIVGKRLRYILELLGSEEATAIVKQLKKLQDTSGDLHDLQVLEPKVQNLLYAETMLWAQTFRDGARTFTHDELKELPELRHSYGLAEVARRIEQEKTILYKALETHWLGTSSEDFFRDTDEFIRQLTNENPNAANERKPRPSAAKSKRKRKTRTTP